MPWVAVDALVEQNSKVRSLAQALGWDPDQVLARMVRFWLAVRVEAPDGDVTSWSAIRSASAMGRPPSEAETIREAMIEVGLLVQMGPQLIVAGWDERNGRWSKDAQRKRATRSTSIEQRPRLSADRPGPSANVRASRARAEQEQEQEQEHHREGVDTPSLALPVADTPAPLVTSQEPEPEPAPTPEENRARVAQLVAGIGSEMAVPRRSPDMRPQLWDLAQAHAGPKAPADKLMAVASWLWYTAGKHDLLLIAAALRKIGRAANPYAYLQPGGAALEAMVGEIAVERAEREREVHRAEDRKLGLARPP